MDIRWNKRSLMKHMLIMVELSFIIGLFGCDQDDGNYGYRDPGTVDFFGMVEDTVALIGDPFVIEAVFTTAADESDLSFLWYAVTTDEEGKGIADTLGTEKNLSILMNLPAGDQEVNFIVYNRKLDVNYLHIVNVEVTTAFSTGWSILKEKEGMPEYDFISSVVNEYFQNILSTVSEVSMEGTPVAVQNTFQPSFNDEPARIFTYIVSEQDVYIFDRTNMELESDGYMEMFASYDFVELPFEGGYYYANVAETFLLFADEKVYIKGGNIAQNSWSAPLPGDYSISHTSLMGHRENLVFFDHTNERYATVNLYFDGRDSVEALIEPGEPGAFDFNDLSGKQCLWIGDVWSSTNSGFSQGISVLKNVDSTFLMHVFEIDEGPTFHARGEVQVPNGYISDNSLFVNNPEGIFTYYTDGVGNIGWFRHDIESPGPEDFYLTFITDYNGEQITALAIDGGYSDANGVVSSRVLAFALANGANSTIILYDFVDKVEISRYEVEGRVVEIEYAKPL